MRKKLGRFGLRKVTVPNLSGLNRSQAQSILSSLGLNYSESTTDTGSIELTNGIASQGSAHNSTVSIGSTIPFVYYNYVNPVVYTYGPCEAYGSATTVGSGNQCSGEYSQQYVDYQYNTRKKIYADGVWDGSSYTSSGCSPTTSRSIITSAQVNGQCGYVTPPVITYGDCEAYGSATNLGDGTQCSGEYYQSYTNYQYNTRKKIYADGVWDGSSYSTSGCGTTTSKTINSSAQVNGQCGYVTPVAVTYGPCEAYGSVLYSTSSGTQCSGDFTQNWTNYVYSSRKKIYYDGSWDGSSYTSSGCGEVTVKTVTSSSQVNGSCGYTTPPPAEVYGSCESYTFTSPTCNGEDSYVGNYTGYRRTSNYGNTTTSGCSGAAFTGFGACIARNVSSCGGVYSSGTTCTPTCSSLSGLPCGYNNTGTYDCNGTCTGASQPPASCTCNYSDMGSYHYSPQCCSSGSARTGSLGGTSSGACCPNVNKTQKWECKSYDVTNSASSNYYTCYSVGACTANVNSDGSRTVCYV